ncbi:MAG: hypothetical protein HY817_03990 [Candidatus Abawacabacteria bacterium]|nr:hypothetical protein [Candidatus Abawacabacteria bacterium]
MSPKYFFFFARHIEVSVINDIHRLFFDQVGDRIECEFYQCQEKVDMEVLIKQKIAAGYNHFIACGGDGTFSLLATPLLHSDCRVGIIPLGSANVLAHELDLPLTYPEALQVVLAEENILRIDSFKSTQGVFFTTIDVGLNSIAIKQTSRRLKKLLGVWAYWWQGIKTLFRLHPYQFTLDTGMKSYLVPATNIVVANTGAVLNKKLRMSTKVSIVDGTFSIFILKSKSIWDMLHVLGSRIFHYPANKHVLESLHDLTQVQISCDCVLPVQGDGDIIGNLPISIKIIPQAIQVIVGKKN